jgi:hypothetical protein
MTQSGQVLTVGLPLQANQTTTDNNRTFFPHNSPADTESLVVNGLDVSLLQLDTKVRDALL